MKRPESIRDHVPLSHFEHNLLVGLVQRASLDSRCIVRGGATLALKAYYGDRFGKVFSLENALCFESRPDQNSIPQWRYVCDIPETYHGKPSNPRDFPL